MKINKLPKNNETAHTVLMNFTLTHISNYEDMESWQKSL